MGDVESPSTNPVVTGVLKIVGKADQAFRSELPLSDVGYTPYYSIASASKSTAVHGESIDMQVDIHEAWHHYYANARRLENPSTFILLPPGFELDTSSFQTQYVRGNGTSSAPYKVTNATNPPAGYTIWRVDHTTIMYRENSHIQHRFKIRVTDNVLPGVYDLEKNVFIGSNNPKYQVNWAWGQESLNDPYGLW